MLFDYKNKEKSFDNVDGKGIFTDKKDNTKVDKENLYSRRKFLKRAGVFGLSGIGLGIVGFGVSGVGDNFLSKNKNDTYIIKPLKNKHYSRSFLEFAKRARFKNPLQAARSVKSGEAFYVEKLVTETKTSKNLKIKHKKQ